MVNIKGIIYAIISSATFGLIPLFSIPLIKEGFNSPSILFYRLGVAAFILAMIALVCRKSLRIEKRDVLTFIYLGSLYAITSLWLLKSYSFLASGVATTIHFLYPLAVTLIMVVVFRERRSLWLLMAAIISLVGVGILSWSSSEEGVSEIRGVLMVLVTVVTYAVYIVSVNKSRVRNMDSVVVTFYVLTFGGAIFLIYALLCGGVEPLRSMSSLWNVLLLALLPTVLSNFALVMAVKQIGSTTTSILGSMEPLAATMVGVLHFGEVFSAHSVVGMCMIIASVIMVVLLGSDKKTIEK